MTDGLFPEPVPEHPDAAVARRIITGYYTEQAETARKAVEVAQAAYDRARGRLDAWTERGEIGSDMLPAGIADRLNLAVYAIVGEADSAHMSAMRAAIPEYGGRRTAETLAAAAQAEEDAQAVRRWLVAQGHSIPGEEPPRAGRRRGKRDGSL